jgi:serpin B
MRRLLLSLVSLLGCSTQPTPPVCGAPQGSASDVQALASSDTAFALAFFPQATAAAGGEAANVIVSPYSVSATLTMVDVGAAGDTDSQLRATLHLPANASTIGPAYAALACADETDGDADGQTLSLANAVWAQTGKTFQPAFLSALSSGYNAPVQLTDFAGNSSGAANDINAWVSLQTQGQIPTLLQPSDLSSASRLVLVNAVYFKGTWDAGFDVSQTAPRTFTRADGTTVPVPTMTGLMNVGVGGSTALSLYELPYKGGGLAMDFIVPIGGTLTALEATLTPAVLQAALPTTAPEQQTNLYLPKFAFKTRLVLTSLLAGMGMPDLFDPNKANLSGMDGQTDLSVDTVVQQATVEVDESGTVATAATAADTCSCSAFEEPPTIHIDHPFVFLIRDTRNGNILFMGQVEDPSKGS